MTVDKSLKAKLFRMTHFYCALVSTLDEKGANAASIKDRNWLRVTLNNDRNGSQQATDL